MTVTPFVPPYLPRKESYKPTHPDLFLINFGEGDFTSSLVAQKSFNVGEVLCDIQGTVPGTKAYSSVQVLPDPPVQGQDLNEPRHIELCSDLLYVNHSCDPNVAFEIGKQKKWVVRALKPINKGDILTFAYFSTEWNMDQPFDCLCGSPRCLGTIRGAKHIDPAVLSKYFINDHIKLQVEQQKKA